MYIFINQIYFCFFQYVKNYTLFFLKMWRTWLFKLELALFIYKKLASYDDAYLGWRWSKIWLFRIKRADFSVIVNNSVKAILFMLFLYFLYFQFFQIIIVSLFFAHHDQYFTMFKDSNAFQFTNFQFKTKYNTKLWFILLPAIIYSEGKTRKKLLKQFFH